MTPSPSFYFLAGRETPLPVETFVLKRLIGPQNELVELHCVPQYVGAPKAHNDNAERTDLGC